MDDGVSLMIARQGALTLNVALAGSDAALVLSGQEAALLAADQLTSVTSDQKIRRIIRNPRTRILYKILLYRDT